ncbi:hypothetical protein ACYKVK_004452, partial [Enterobacter hormaechei]
MATTPTNLPVPSESPRDLKFNAGKIDEFVTSLVNTYVDRFGNEHYTIEGLRWLAQQAISAFGYVTLDSFEDGNTLSLPNQVLRFEATGEYYRWDGPLPKSVPAGSTPQTSGGIGPGAWLSVGDAVLRSMLASTGGADLIGLDPSGTVADAITYVTPEMYFIAGEADWGGALQRAIDSRKEVRLGERVYTTSLPILIYSGTVINGCGNQHSVIRKVGN